nr:response regulator [Neobacillus sp. Marseille-Q6967]
MSFKMLIVDDEPIIGRGLSLTIPWSEHGIEIAGIAYNGAEAIEKIKAHGEIDIVITDVRMPKMDGIELAACLAQTYPRIKIVIISGYDEFKYAQKAIQSGVQDYLLKPVDVEELLTIISKITNDLQKQNSESQQVFMTLLENAIYQQVFDVQLKNQYEWEITENVRLYPILSMMNEYVSTTQYMTDEELEEMNSNWSSLIETHLRNKGYDSVSIFTDQNILLTCVVGELNHKEMIAILKEIQSSYSLSFVVNNCDVPINELSGAYQELCSGIKHLPFLPEGYVVVPAEEPLHTDWQPLSDEMESHLINAIFQVNESKINTLTDELFKLFEEKQLYLEDLVQLCKRLLTKIVERYASLFRKNHHEIDLVFEQEVDVNQYNSFVQLKKLFKEDIENVTKELAAKNIENSDWLIERAVNYIKTYYASNIKAHEVADFINISPNYFSTLFKQNTGKSFNEYINELRVEQAKVLLEETPFKVNEIAEKVGYHEYKYFVEIFKKISGLTPTQYRKLLSTK